MPRVTAPGLNPKRPLHYLDAQMPKCKQVTCKTLACRQLWSYRAAPRAVATTSMAVRLHTQPHPIGVAATASWHSSTTHDSPAHHTCGLDQGTDKVKTPCSSTHTCTALQPALVANSGKQQITPTATNRYVLQLCNACQQYAAVSNTRSRTAV